ncbi:STAS domain-containing protein [Bacillus sp. P14.5]|uniref:STAS domain-containing protein n=1 Tax=Bacillus sp. P14.5 TaxID=1983400 RepID=UPI000DEAC294|nr:STAS domain-containing protein [Bacillus sp. P14.5]
MTDDWLDSRKDSSGYSVYSKNASAEMESTLRSQNSEFIESLAYVFICKDNFGEKVVLWAEKIAQERVKNGTSIFEVVQQFGIFRRILWRYIEKFINDHNPETPQVLEWSRELNSGFDSVIEKFTEIYHAKTKESLSKQENLIKAIISPVIPVTESVAIFPLLGNLNITIAEGLADSVLEQCTKYNITRLFIDISGVGTIDTMIANQIFQMICSLKLIGVEAYLSGIRPELAMTAVHLGIDFKDYPSYSSLKQALKENGLHVESLIR